MTKAIFFDLFFTVIDSEYQKEKIMKYADYHVNSFDEILKYVE